MSAMPLYDNYCIQVCCVARYLEYHVLQYSMCDKTFYDT